MLCRNHVEVAEGVRRCARCQVPFCPDCLVEIQGRPYCATCKTEQLMDVRSGVDRTLLPYASPWKRLGAIILDGLLINLPLYLVFIVLSFVLSDTPGEPHPMIIFASIPLLFAQL
ncbi:MAG TPA: hypothetical protein VHK90_03110, partial [Thermoanaerobaculia bacterium]|nr:hypothetical protein [Thermoanaerobaculia bacterium]